MTPTRNSFPGLVSRLAVVAALGGMFGAEPPAHACDPDKIRGIKITPKEVNVPVGGEAEAMVVVDCTLSDDEWVEGATLRTGGMAQFNVRLIDSDGSLLSPDKLGEELSTQTRRKLPDPPGFRRPHTAKLTYKLECPGNTIEGGSVDSGEGEVGGSDPADLALQIDEGDSELSTEHKFTNVDGGFAPARCVAVEEDEADSSSASRTAFLIGSSHLLDPCEGQRTAAVAAFGGGVRQGDPCLEGASLFFGDVFGAWTIQGTHSEFFQPDDPDNALPLILEMEALEPAFSEVPGANQQGPVTIRISAAEHFVTVQGPLAADGTFTATGRGTVIRVRNTPVRMEGTFRGGRLEATYTIGDPARGGWALGAPAVFPVTAQSVGWTDFLEGVANSIESAGEAFGTLNYQASFGGVDFSRPAIGIAGDLLQLEAVLRSPSDRPFVLEDGEILEDPAAEALADIEAQLTGFADAIAGSSLVSRGPAEAQLRLAATAFGDTQTALTDLLEGLQLAPAQPLADSVNRWLAAIGRGGAALEAFIEIALGGEFVTVSAASFAGPIGAAEEIVSGFGQNLAPGVKVATELPLPTSFDDISIRITDSAGAEFLAGLFFSSSGQFNYLIPAGVAPGEAIVTVFSGDRVIATGRIVVHSVAPSVFTANSDGAGVAASVVVRVAADGSQSSLAIFTDGAPGSRSAIPIDLGPEGEQVVLLLFGTGIRGGADIRVRANGEDAQVLGFAASQEFVGLDQINVLLSRALIGQGEVTIEVIVDGVPANSVTMSVL